MSTSEVLQEPLKILNLSLLITGFTLSILLVWLAATTAAPVPERGGPGQIRPSEDIHFEVELVNPIEPDEQAVAYRVYLRLDERGFPREYRMPLVANICPEGVCKLMEITLFWDPLGRHTRFEYPSGADQLTKYDDIPFTADDYQTLSAAVWIGTS